MSWPEALLWAACGLLLVALAVVVIVGALVDRLRSQVESDDDAATERRGRSL